MYTRLRTTFNGCPFRLRTLAVALGLTVLGASPAHAYDWLQMNGSPSHSGNNPLEKSLNHNNVASLTQRFQASLPAVADGAPVLLRRVSTAGGVRDLLFVTTKAGHIVALDAHTGTQVWIKQFGAGSCKINNGSNTCFTTSSPAIDPLRTYVYTYGLDGFVHKLQVGDGTETTTGGWPQLATVKGFDEKGSSALSFATVGATTYLYVTHGGYPGDQGDYQGHVTAINLGTGTQQVFNSMCSDQAVHLMHLGTAPSCVSARSAIWARPGVIYDASLGRIFMGTGNGGWNGTNNWSESVFALNPDGTGAGGKPLDVYTPADQQQLDNGDTDLGSSAPAILPVPASSKVQHLAVQAGKDGDLRLLNLANLSGAGGPGHIGGEIGSVISVPQGTSVVLTQPAVWVNPADGNTSVFVANPSGISGISLQFDGSGNPSLAAHWTNAQSGQGGFSPIVANNIVYYSSGTTLRALDPTSGVSLWTGAIGGTHWESPVVANGMVYVTDESAKLTAFAPSYVPTVVDFNANGKTDLLWHSSGGLTASWLMNGAAPTAVAALMSDPNWQVAAVGDFNGDDKADLVWRNSASGQTSVWQMNGQATTASAVVMTDTHWTVNAVADFNGDGKSDLVWYNATTGQTAMWLMNGITPSTTVIVYADPNWSVRFTGDFDGDGNADLLWRNDATGQTAIWLMHGVNATASAIVYADTAWSVIATGDFDGDGKSDLLWHNATTGQFVVWLMNGTTATGASVILADPKWELAGTGDFNGDGTTDLVLYNATTGQTAIYLMNGLRPSATSIIYADPNWAVTATGDLDGDGKSDLIWSNPATGQTAVWLMNGTSPTTTQIIYADPNWSVANPSN